MNFFLIVFIISLIVICVLIISSVLLQEDKSGGGIGILGGSSQSFFGVSSGSFLAKITSILLVIFFLSGITIAILASRFTSESTITETDISRTQYSDVNVQVTEINKLIDEEKKEDIDKENKDQTNDETNQEETLIEKDITIDEE